MWFGQQPICSATDTMPDIIDKFRRKKEAERFDQLIGLVQQKTGEARQQIERTLSEISDQAGGAFTQASEAARQYVDQAGEKLRGAADQIREHGRETYEEAQQMFRRRPAESVAVAFGTGLVVGLIVGLVASSRDR